MHWGAGFLRSITGKTPAVALLLAALLIPAAGPASAADPAAVQASMETLRGLELTVQWTLPPQAAPSWRASLDGDGSGAVSAEEAATLAAVVEDLIQHPLDGALEAYNKTWDAENASGARTFTLDGRANFSAFALALARQAPIGSNLDGTPGAFERVAFDVTNLVGPRGTNATLEVMQSFVFTWGPANASRPVHRLEITTPPLLSIALRVGGALEIVGNASFSSAATNRDRTQIVGTTSALPAAVMVRDRPTTDFALLVVAAAILAPAVAVVVVAFWTGRWMRVKETPLPVEPRYK